MMFYPKNEKLKQMEIKWNLNQILALVYGLTLPVRKHATFLYLETKRNCHQL